MKSVVRVPEHDPKYKIAVLVSKQVRDVVSLAQTCEHTETYMCLCILHHAEVFLSLHFLQEHCLIDLLHQWQDGRLPVDITCVIRLGFGNLDLIFSFSWECWLTVAINVFSIFLFFSISNHDRGPNTHVFRFLERHGIPYHYLRTANDNKSEGEILELVQNTDFLVLARYMQVIMLYERSCNINFFFSVTIGIEVYFIEWREQASFLLNCSFLSRFWNMKRILFIN